AAIRCTKWDRRSAIAREAVACKQKWKVFEVRWMQLFPVDDFDLCGCMRIGTSFAVGHPQLCTSFRCKPLNILLRSNDLSPVVILEQHFRVTSALHGEGLGIRVDLHQLTLESFLGLWRSLLRCRLFLPVSQG